MTPHNHSILTATLARIRRPRPVYKPLPPPERYSARQALMRICNTLGVSVEGVLSDNRKREFVNVRFIIAHYLVVECKMTLERAAEALNRKSHATISYYVGQYNDLISTRNSAFLKMAKQVDL
jgi:chromosomal replication initiation ATPase DnaA